MGLGNTTGSSLFKDIGALRPVTSPKFLPQRHWSHGGNQPPPNTGVTAPPPPFHVLQPHIQSCFLGPGGKAPKQQERGGYGALGCRSVHPSQYQPHASAPARVSTDICCPFPLPTGRHGRSSAHAHNSHHEMLPERTAMNTS